MLFSFVSSVVVVYIVVVVCCLLRFPMLSSAWIEIQKKKYTKINTPFAAHSTLSHLNNKF